MSETVKGYELHERIGSGGFGVVHRAYQSTVGREVAIKIILPYYANQPDFIRRFDNEAQLVARLEHLHIVPLYDYWRDPDGAYLVMRWLRGGSLKEMLKSGPCDVTRASKILDQLASALSTAHRHAVIHRDIKPSNILLDEDGNAYVSDFGIAKDMTHQESNTGTDTVLGSPGYLAPEQARNEPVSPRTDVYSLGVVLYELLCGEHPFPDANNVERIFKHLNEPLPALPALANVEQELVDRLNEVVQKATQKNPIHRYHDPLALAAALREHVSSQPIFTPESIIEQLTRREQEILQLIIERKTNREIAAQLFVAHSTVRWYITQIYKKLNVRNRQQAIIKAEELQLVYSLEDIDNGSPDSSEHVTYLYLPEPENPYKGLRSFTIVDERDYYGRKRIVDKLVKRLNQTEEDHYRFLAVVGPSGSGKSSLVRAGLIPAIWRGELPGSENWFVADMLPGSHPIDELEVALMRVAADKAETIGSLLEHNERGLLKAAQLILPDDGSELLLIIDQFEEVFTLVEDAEHRRHFLDLLHAAVTDSRSRVRIVITLRADFYDRPLHYPQISEMVRNRMETLLPLSAEELEAAIVEPAKRVGVTYEDGLVSSIISDIHYQPGALPLLQYALTELFDRRDGRAITRQAYSDIGGTVGALARRADDIYHDFNEEGQQAIRQMFLRLVTLGEGTEDTRRRVERSELMSIAGDSEDLMDEVITAFAERRLLSLDHDPASRTPTVEVAHEAILREWEMLRDWLNESRDDIKMQRLLGQAADAWHQNNSDVSYLVGGSRLERFERWATETQLALTPLERTFVEESVGGRERQRAAAREQQEREARLEQRARTVLRTLVAVFAVAAAIGTGLALFALNARSAETRARQDAEASEQEALHQVSIGLAAQAVAQLDGDAPERGVLLALVALEEYPYTPQAERALAQTVYHTHQYITLRSGRNRLRDIAFSPDGRLIAGTQRSIEVWDSVSSERLTEFNIVTSEDQAIVSVDWFSDNSALLSASQELGIVSVWDITTGEELLRYEAHEGAVNSAYLSADNRMALSASADETARVWFAETGETVKIFAEHDSEVNDAIWSPDETKVATASSDGKIRFWDVESEAELLNIDAHLGGVTALSWSFDSTRIASSGDDGLGRVWDAETGELLFTLIGHDAPVRDIEWSPDDSLLATAGGDGVARVWETLAGNEMFVLSGSAADVVAVSWAPDGKRLAVGGGASSRVWDVSTPIVRLIGHSAGDNAFVSTNFPYWSPDSSWVGTGGYYDNTYRIWNSVTGENIRTFEDVPGAFASINMEGTEIFLINPPRIMNLDTGEERLFPVPEEFGDRFAIKWSPDGAMIALYVDNSPKYAIFDATTFELLYAGSQRCSFSFEAQFSPDGVYLAQTCPSFEFTSVIITETLTGNVVQELEGHTDAPVLARWSPDGSKLATTSGDKTVRIWDVVTGETLTVFTGHTAITFDVDWSPDGTRLVSGDTAGNMLVWDAETGEEVNRYNVGGSVLFIDWSPDGTRVLTTGGFDAPDIRPVWQSTAELIAYAKECCVTRSLTPDERQQFGLP